MPELLWQSKLPAGAAEPGNGHFQLYRIADGSLHLTIGSEYGANLTGDDVYELVMALGPVGFEPRPMSRRGLLGRVLRCRKVSYEDRRNAEAVLELWQARGSAVRRVYFCWQCRAWHLTSQDLRGS